MKRVLLPLVALLLSASCQKKQCVTCTRDYYDHNVKTSTEQLESQCGLTSKEAAKVKGKYPASYNPENVYVAGSGGTSGWYYHCDNN